MKILGIETSFDETGVAIVEDGTKIISSLGGGYNYEIQVMNTDGSNRTELFSGRRPDWTW